jgi:malate dehydrogenase (oxaloacetate-decarboxylating)
MKTLAPHPPEALTSPSLNRGTAFDAEQRRALGLTGRLPSAVLTLEDQAQRLWQQLQSLPTDLARDLLLEVLYFTVLSEHLPELLPVVYDPTVDAPIEQYSEAYRGQRGVYLSIDRPEEIAESFKTLGLGPDDVDLIECSDAEEILGIGDWGVGGIEISIGKLAIYTAGAGVDPSRTIPVSLDVGTDNETLLNDPLYLGNRHARHRGADYDAFIATYIETAHRLFPNAMLHFVDFGPEHARAILARYSPDYCVFDDDVQGTRAVVMGAVYSGLKVAGSPMRDQKLVVFGSGTAGVGIADQVRDAMIADGATQEQATAQVWLVDKQGLLFDDRDELRDFQQPYAKNRKQFGVPEKDRVGLVETIKMASATILLGTSTVHGAFTRDVIEAMAASTERPLIFPISKPTEKIEAIPADVLNWSRGKALVATGIPMDPVQYNRATYEIGQANNFLAFPGLGLGVIVAGARRVTRGMLEAAAKAVAREADVSAPGAALLPNVKNLRALSAAVAEAVYTAAVADGVATKKPDDVVQAIADTMWLPHTGEATGNENPERLQQS